MISMNGPNHLVSWLLTMSILRQDGPNHLGLWCKVLPGHQMALITSGCVKKGGHPPPSPFRSHHADDIPLWGCPLRIGWMAFGLAVAATRERGCRKPSHRRRRVRPLSPTLLLIAWPRGERAGGDRRCRGGQVGRRQQRAAGRPSRAAGAAAAATASIGSPSTSLSMRPAAAGGRPAART